MPQQPVDLRSDTVTRPTSAMRDAMRDAEVGDDVFGDDPIAGEDPTVNRLQAAVAERLGKEAALYVPSGSMSNQLAVRVHCAPGDELICEAGCHVYNYEQGGYAQLSGVCARAVEGDSGVLHLEQLTGLIRPDDEHLVRTRLVCLENTHNRGGGRVLPYDEVESICAWAHDHGLATHLDGARLFNAVVAGGIDAQQWCRHFDTVSVCFSKGLGAPVGSALAGSREAIVRARRYRKLFGGGMRQAGIIAAGALYALEHHVERLAEDHAHAQLLAEAVRDCPGLAVATEHVDTNILIIAVDESLGTAGQFVARLAAAGVLTIPFGGQLIRAVTHLDVDRPAIERAGAAIAETARAAAAGEPLPEARSAYARLPGEP